MSLFVSFLICAVLASVVFKSLAQGLIRLSDYGLKVSLGMKRSADAEVPRRHPRLAACWDYAQSVFIGALFSLVILSIRVAFIDMGGAPFLYGLASLAWTLTTGIGFKTNPGTVFFTCATGVLLGFFIGLWGSLAAGLLFSVVLVGMWRSRKLDSPPLDPSEVIVDVDSE